MKTFQTINFKKWIEENRDKLKPPVCNEVIWRDREFIVMVVGGPNSRTDYHVNTGEEFFYQIEGKMNLKIINEGVAQDLIINEGEIFLLPPNVPHSPQRYKNTVGLVIEHMRADGVKDGFQWYCEKCHHKLYEEFLHVSDIVKQLPPVFERFYSDNKHTTCTKCGHKAERNA